MTEIGIMARSLMWLAPQKRCSAFLGMKFEDKDKPPALAASQVYLGFRLTAQLCLTFKRLSFCWDSWHLAARWSMISQRLQGSGPRQHTPRLQARTRPCLGA